MATTSTLPSVDQFLADLPPDRRREVERVRAVVRANLPVGYEEVVSSNMLVYQVPLVRYSDTYNGHPLWYVALASQKSYLSLHLLRIYGDDIQTQRLKDAFKAAGKKLNLGKACIRFQRAEDLALEGVAEVVASTPADRWVEIAESARRR